VTGILSQRPIKLELYLVPACKSLIKRVDNRISIEGVHLQRLIVLVVVACLRHEKGKAAILAHD